MGLEHGVYCLGCCWSLMVLLFVGGMAINQWSDTRLIGLRKNGNGYQIPRGGLFERISCPNHFGEIVEWTGFAILCWSVPALSFAVWTAANLIPRALSHRWRSCTEPSSRYAWKMARTVSASSAFTTRARLPPRGGS